MTKLYIIAGHGAGDPGACNANGTTEAERVRALAQRIKDLGGEDVVLHPFSDNAYSSGAINTLSIPSDWQIVELHMDAAIPAARGGHVIVQAGYDPDTYDIALEKMISGIFPGRSVTLVKRGDLANPSRAAARGLSYRLVENGFISNDEDLDVFNSRLDDIARGYLNCFELAPSTNSVTVPSPTPVQSQDGTDDENFGGTYKCQATHLQVRDAPGLNGNIVKYADGTTVYYNDGDTVVLDDWYVIQDGYVWGRYTGGTSGQLRYIAVGKATGKPEVDDYLIKI